MNNRWCPLRTVPLCLPSLWKEFQIISGQRVSSRLLYCKVLFKTGCWSTLRRTHHVSSCILSSCDISVPLSVPESFFFFNVTSFTHFRASILFKKLFDFAVRRTQSLQSVLFKMGIIKHLLHFNYFHLWVRMAPSKRKAVPDAAWVPEPE